MSTIDLSEYENDPNNTHLLMKLSNECADRNQNESACLFAESVLMQQDIPAELKVAALERLSILGFYTKQANRKVLAKNACEILSMDRSLPWSTRNTARMNHTWYAKTLIELVPDAEFTHTAFTPPEKYSPMNPSIYTWDNQLWMIQRTVNYIITPHGSYDMQGDTAIKTRNFLLKLNPDLSVASAGEILLPDDLPEPLYTLVLGFEDCRLFAWNDSLWCTSTVRELNQPGYCQIVLARIDPLEDGNYKLSNWRHIAPKGLPVQNEKNWMPQVVGDKLHFVYSHDPLRVIDDQGNTVSCEPIAVAADGFRGGSQVIKFDNGWLDIIHESHNMHDGRRRYTHRFVYYDQQMRLVGYSDAFFLKENGIEFAAGIAINPVTTDVVVSFGFNDRDSWMVSLTKQAVRQLLKPALNANFDLDPKDIVWVESQVNRALQDNASVDRATMILDLKGLYKHEDRVKNWDNLIALWYTVKTTDPILPVMDVAATKGSAYLPSLRNYGFKNLISINLTQTTTEINEGITYQYGDCTKTNFSDGFFGFISCLSVIEHGVDVEAFFAESARILRPGGHLFVSADYWQDPVDTYGQVAFGVPVKMFTQSEVDDMVVTARKYGLEAVRSVDATCKDRVVNWIGIDYTFVNLLFYKVA